ncbi:E3 ubiquitin--protein ligase [Bradyrhizobium sp. NBAIM03]|nr:E3 ubiquitin--protein ligase [Bradyrhizobium sp. BRP05]MCA1393564.1 E3 ubiquitin--protein ligase [Bradyrhizobium sp. IC3123]MCA1420983.1 E3 ubiquitin--protein ligase [Bradyrhizobium sp. BRP23]MCA1430710.1 E3 ubiquitin--protein ligase [Bradyrhizobium sp. NBAIM16]MCA1479909.1 E3 ubiquitin--protein ligase [Bradyrhizobium sp. NBAIM08]MCA1498426.1 E3 ubiquitin--protein ligase [Bradyrhizobium sp. NBAIM14]MCA1506096.1 E3 ubiquitin--protein ligase [Bradyrhizobium sp. NBAIM02]MCA1534653.1 E3 ubiqu
MNAEQLGPGTPSATSNSESSELGSAGASQWGEALTDVQASAAEATAWQEEVLTDWAAEDGQGQNEDRQQAVSRTRAWRRAGDINELLDLSSLSLTALSAPILAGVRRLNVDDNQLNSLPERLPATLQELDARGNRLTQLPGLPAGLQRLNVEYNQLTDLPEPLPGELEWLSASHNRLTSLPETVPPQLIWLGASNNYLTNVPETLLTQLSSDSSVDLENNPLAERVQAGLATAMHAGDYAGPQVFFSTADGPVEVQPRSLQEVAADWLEGEPTAMATWQHFAHEPGAADYARFLDRLRGTVNYGNEAFRQAVAEDLRQAAVRPHLREEYFELASGANASCEDRITLAWNGMQTARLNADVEDGVYDGRLGELLQHGRVMFRLEALDGIARERVNSLRRAYPDVDEIEVYLAYQTQLRDALELRHIAPDMRFMNVSHVSEDDVARAEASVRNQEAAEFPDYLAARWQPWESVVRRIAPEDYAEMQERLVDAMGVQFQTRLDERLAEHGLTGDADAERVLGAQIRNEIAREIKSAVMHQVLGKLGIELRAPSDARARRSA